MRSLHACYIHVLSDLLGFWSPLVCREKKTMKELIVFGVSLVVMGIGVMTTSPIARISTRPCVVMTGADSEVTDPSYQRILSEDEWVKVWQQHKGQEAAGKYDFFYDPLALPRIDFEQYMVVVILEGGGWNCAGLTAESVTEKEEQITMRFGRKPFQTAGPDGGGRKVSVYGFFVLPRSTKPVVLEQKTYARKGAKPSWKECFRFEAIKD